MKRIIMCCLALSAFSCNNQQAKEPSKPVDTVKSPIIKAEPKEFKVKNTIPAYSDDIYRKYIPAPVFELLDQQLPDWKLPSPNTWEKFWFQEYKRDSSLINYTSGDFNGDDRPDYALILVNADKEFTVWVLQSEQGRYKAIKLHETTGLTLPIDMGLELTPKGELNYIDLDNDNPKPIQLKHPAITVAFFERAAQTYYWKDGKYESVTTGD